MATPFEEFVNAELPQRIRIDFPASGNLESGKILETTGIGLEVNAVDYPTWFTAVNFNLEGDWNAASGVYPVGPHDNGDVWRVSTAGTTNSIYYYQNDFIVYDTGVFYQLTGPNHPGADKRWVYTSSNVNLEAGDKIAIDTSGASRTAYLPTSGFVQGDEIRIMDAAGTFGSNNLIVDHNGGLINGSAGPTTLSVNRSSITIVYIDPIIGWARVE